MVTESSVTTAEKAQDRDRQCMGTSFAPPNQRIRSMPLIRKELGRSDVWSKTGLL